ncbi:hypothetical protein RISK_000032 [Rhodopirellula islandica]|uniref:Uncharacterized protein n=1 Tax=Rhodopirellula islandica TaxID=595434 RepID=A0A0J1BN09_RHOIS|nr:hypothetical protein RISK_000032 [Rhodopirellula islandica]
MHALPEAESERKKYQIDERGRNSKKLMKLRALAKRQNN